MLGFSFGSGLTLVHLEPSSPRLFAAADHLECRYVRAYFREQGTAAAQYIQVNLAGMYETAEDLIALGNEAIAFHVEPTSYRLCQELSGVIKQLDGGMRIFWFGDWAASLPERELPETVESLVRRQPERMLHRLVEPDVQGSEGGSDRGRDELDLIPSIWEEAASSRQAPLLAVKLADRLGRGMGAYGGRRTHSPQRLRRDLELAVAASRQLRPELKLQGFHEATEEAARWNKIVGVLESCRERAAWSIDLPMERWLRGDALGLAEVGACELGLELPVSLKSGQPIAAEIMQQLRQIREVNPDIRFRIILQPSAEDTESGARSTAILLQECLDNGLIGPSAIHVKLDAADGPLARTVLPASLEELARERLGSESEGALINGFWPL
ncbi:hypothetical protein [Paenibacillus herberti]|uniref:Uncharacterized protein n=1 Tax=Paenibacillus herberti TaxID=1619309 RepID=A0A229NYF5_9BACL|nr:hypothetical protein [Paenibacillus herberti]OXM14791.1 hypothetical protein CGZ75_18135 [Paenibacillus herberti]